MAEAKTSNYQDINDLFDKMLSVFTPAYREGAFKDHGKWNDYASQEYQYKSFKKYIFDLKEDIKNTRNNIIVDSLSPQYMDKLRAFSKTFKEKLENDPKNLILDIKEIYDLTIEVFDKARKQNDDNASREEISHAESLGKEIKSILYFTESVATRQERIIQYKKHAIKQQKLKEEKAQKKAANKARRKENRQKAWQTITSVFKKSNNTPPASAPQANTPSAPRRGFWKTFNAVGDFLGRASNIAKAAGTLGTIALTIWGGTSILGKSDKTQQVTPGNTGIDHTINIADEKPDHSALHASQSDLSKVDTAHYSQGTQNMPAQQRAK